MALNSRNIKYVNMKPNKALQILRTISFLVGIIFIILSIIATLYTYTTTKNYIPTTATITDISSYRNVRHENIMRISIEYSVDGTKYEKLSDFYNPSMYVGKQINIYYNPINPNEISFGFFNFVWLIFFIVGFIFFSIGLIMIIYHGKSKKKYQMLRENGQKIYATIENITQNTSIRVNGKSPYIITCKWMNMITGNTYLFKSPNIWFNPQPILFQRNITMLLVYIDRENPEKYFVSIDEIG